jgi:hypothetical protein
MRSEIETKSLHIQRRDFTMLYFDVTKPLSVRDNRRTCSERSKDCFQLTRRSCHARLDTFLEVTREAFASDWPAPGSEDTELGVLMEPEVGHGEAEVYTRVQA